jgi:hypothetical protein
MSRRTKFTDAALCAGMGDNEAARFFWLPVTGQLSAKGKATSMKQTPARAKSNAVAGFAAELLARAFSEQQMATPALFADHEPAAKTGEGFWLVEHHLHGQRTIKVLISELTNLGWVTPLKKTNFRERLLIGQATEKVEYVAGQHGTIRERSLAKECAKPEAKIRTFDCDSIAIRAFAWFPAWKPTWDTSWIHQTSGDWPPLSTPARADQDSRDSVGRRSSRRARIADLPSTKPCGAGRVGRVAWGGGRRRARAASERWFNRVQNFVTMDQ